MGNQKTDKLRTLLMRMISAKTLIAAFVVACCCCYAQNTIVTALPISIVTPNTATIMPSGANVANHSTFFRALKTTGLDKVLEKLGPYTVFAPSDEAFAKLSPIAIDDLFKEENREQLKSLLNYHIVTGKLSASDILSKLCQTKGAVTYGTIHGEKIEAKIEGLNIIIIDNQGNKATIIDADVDQGAEGTFHGIDKVIMPSKI